MALSLLGMVSVARADDPIKDVIDREVPTLKSGARITLEEVEKAILAACARRRFEATVLSAGTIFARWVHGNHWRTSSGRSHD